MHAVARVSNTHAGSRTPFRYLWDLNLVWINARIYNQPDSTIYSNALILAVKFYTELAYYHPGLPETSRSRTRDADAGRTRTHEFEAARDERRRNRRRRGRSDADEAGPADDSEIVVTLPRNTGRADADADADDLTVRFPNYRRGRLPRAAQRALPLSLPATRSSNGGTSVSETDDPEDSDGPVARRRGKRRAAAAAPSRLSVSIRAMPRTEPEERSSRRRGKRRATAPPDEPEPGESHRRSRRRLNTNPVYAEDGSDDNF